jgi:hypothetical protein
MTDPEKKSQLCKTLMMISRVVLSHGIFDIET